MKIKCRTVSNKSEATIKGIGLAMIATLFAKGLGFTRELLTASTFGTSAKGDAFIVALSIPDILVSGFSTAIATLYIPTYFRINNEIDAETRIIKFNSSVLLLMFLIGITILSIVELFPRQVIMLFAAGFESSTIKIAVMLLRIIAISIIPIFLGSFFKAYGQITSKFALMTLYSCVVNLTIIVSLALYNSTKLECLSYSVLYGNILYAIVTYLSAKRSRLRFSKHVTLKNNYLNDMLLGLFPVFISNIIAEINQIIDKNFASHLEEGTISALNYSSKIINLITAVIGTAISSVLFSNLSKIAAEGNKKKLAVEIENINSYIITILIPIMFALMFFAEPIINSLFGYGNFGKKSIGVTSECLVFYSIGVIGFNLKAIWVRVYNASFETKTPAINSAISVLINIILNVALISAMQHKGLALATGLSSIITDFLLILKYKKINPFFNIRKLVFDVLKIALASLTIIPIFYVSKLLLSSNVYLNTLIIFVSFLAACIPYLLTLVFIKAKFGGVVIRNVKRLSVMINFLKNVVFFIINGLRTVIYSICHLFSVNGKKVFINCFDGKGYGDHPKYIIEELLKTNKNVKIYWTFSGIGTAPHNIKYIKPFSIKAIYHQATSKVWISTVRLPYYSIKRNNQIYFQTWHGGLVFKKIEQECEKSLSSRYIRICKHDSKMIDYYISANAANTKLFKECFWYNGGKILEFGSPRNDIFFNLSENEINYLKNKFNISEERLILYAPTFRTNNSFKAYDLNLLNLIELFERAWGGTWKLVVRLHPRLSSISEKFIEYSEKIVDGSKIKDIQELLAISDVLITDYSSIALDYIIVDRPIFIYASDIEDYKKDRNFHLELKDTPFPITTNQKELENAINLFDWVGYKDNVSKFKEKYVYFDDGKSSQKVATMINKILS